MALLLLDRHDVLELIRQSSSLHDAFLRVAKLPAAGDYKTADNADHAADVRPVVRGRWIKCVGENGVTSACRCSLCGFEDNRFSVFNYCPNCGAEMEES